MLPYVDQKVKKAIVDKTLSETTKLHLGKIIFYVPALGKITR